MVSATSLNEILKDIFKYTCPDTTNFSFDSVVIFELSKVNSHRL